MAANVIGSGTASVSIGASELGVIYQSNGLVRMSEPSDDQLTLLYGESDLPLEQAIDLLALPIGRDMLEYLPGYMQEGNNVRKIQQVIANELQLLLYKKVDVLKQFFVDTATWGLQLWERQLGLPINPENANYANRRATIKAFMGVKGLSSETDFQRRISELLQTSVELKDLDPSVEPYTVAIEASTSIRHPDPSAQPVNEVQRIAPTNTVIGGTYTLTFGGYTTAGLPYNADASSIQAALEALTNIGANGVRVQNGTLPNRPTTVEFLGTNLTHQLSFTATGGTFTLDVLGNTTAALNHSDSAATIQTALEGLASVGVGNVSVTLVSGNKIITFINDCARSNDYAITLDASLLTGGTATLTTLVTGSAGGNDVPLITVTSSFTGPGTYTATELQAGHNGKMLPSISGAGNVTGTYVYKAKFVYASGETGTGDTETDPIVATSDKILLERIPVSNNGAIARKIYRKRSTSLNYYLLHIIEDDVTTSWEDDIPEDGLYASTYGTGTYESGTYGYQPSAETELLSSVPADVLEANTAYDVLGTSLIELIAEAKPAHIHVYLPDEAFRAGINSTGDSV